MERVPGGQTAASHPAPVRYMHGVGKSNMYPCGGLDVHLNPTGSHISIYGFAWLFPCWARPDILPGHGLRTQGSQIHLCRRCGTIPELELCHLHLLIPVSSSYRLEEEVFELRRQRQTLYHNAPKVSYDGWVRIVVHHHPVHVVLGQQQLEFYWISFIMIGCQLHSAILYRSVRRWEADDQVSFVEV